MHTPIITAPNAIKGIQLNKTKVNFQEVKNATIKPETNSTNIIINWPNLSPTPISICSN